MKGKLFFYLFYISMRYIGLCMLNSDKIYSPRTECNAEDYMNSFSNLNASYFSSNLNYGMKNLYNMLSFINEGEKNAYFLVISSVFENNEIDCNCKNVFLLSLILKIRYLRNCLDNKEKVRNDLEFSMTEEQLISDVEKFPEIESCFLDYKEIITDYFLEMDQVEDEYFFFENIYHNETVLWLFQNPNRYILKNKIILDILKGDLFNSIHNSIFHLLFANKGNEKKNMFEMQIFQEIFCEYQIDNIVKNKIDGKNILELLQNWLFNEKMYKSNNIFGTSISKNSVFEAIIGSDVLMSNEGRLLFGILNEAYYIHESHNVDFFNTLKILLIKIYDEISKIKISDFEIEISNHEKVKSKDEGTTSENKEINEIIDSEFYKFEIIFNESIRLLSDLIKKQEFISLINQNYALPIETINSYVILKSFLCDSYQIYEKCEEELKYSNSLQYLDVLLEFQLKILRCKNVDLKFKSSNRFLISIKLLSSLYDSEGSVECINNGKQSLFIYFLQVINISDIENIQEIENLLSEISKQKISEKNKNGNFSMKYRGCGFIEKVLPKFLKLREIYTFKSHLTNSLDFSLIKNNFPNSNKSTSHSTDNSLFLLHKCSTPLQNIDENLVLEFSRNRCADLNQSPEVGNRKEHIQGSSWHSDSRYIPRSSLFLQVKINCWQSLIKKEYTESIRILRQKLDNIQSNISDTEENSELIETSDLNLKSRETNSNENIVSRNSNFQNELPYDFVYKSRITFSQNIYSDRLEDERNILFSLEFKSLPTASLYYHDSLSNTSQNTESEKNHKEVSSEINNKDDYVNILKISKKFKEICANKNRYLFEYEIYLSTNTNFDKDFNEYIEDASIVFSNHQDSTSKDFTDENTFKSKSIENLRKIKEIEFYFNDLDCFQIYDFMRFIRDTFTSIDYFFEDSVRFIGETAKEFIIKITMLDPNNEQFNISEENISIIKNIKECFYKKLYLIRDEDYLGSTGKNDGSLIDTNEREIHGLDNRKIASFLTSMFGNLNSKPREILEKLCSNSMRTCDDDSNCEHNAENSRL